MKAPMIPDRYHKQITENIKPVMARASRSCPNGVESTSETLNAVNLSFYRAFFFAI